MLLDVRRAGIDEHLVLLTIRSDKHDETRLDATIVNFRKRPVNPRRFRNACRTREHLPRRVAGVPGQVTIDGRRNFAGLLLFECRGEQHCSGERSLRLYVSRLPHDDVVPPVGTPTVPALRARLAPTHADHRRRYVGRDNPAGPSSASVGVAVLGKPMVRVAADSQSDEPISSLGRTVVQVPRGRREHAGHYWVEILRLVLLAPHDQWVPVGVDGTGR